MPMVDEHRMVRSSVECPETLTDELPVAVIPDREGKKIHPKGGEGGKGSKSD